MVLWDRDDYLLEAEWQLKNKKIYRSITFNDKLIEDVTERSHKMFKDLRRGGHLSEKQLNYYSLKYKRTCNLGKLNVLPKIHKSLYQKDRSFLIVAPPTEKVPEFLDNHLKPIMHSSWSYIRDWGDFIDKINRIKNIPNDAILVTAGVIGLYPCSPLLLDWRLSRTLLMLGKINLFPLKNFENGRVLKNNAFMVQLRITYRILQ